MKSLKKKINKILNKKAAKKQVHKEIDIAALEKRLAEHRAEMEQMKREYIAEVCSPKNREVREEIKRVYYEIKAEADEFERKLVRKIEKAKAKAKTA